MNAASASRRPVGPAFPSSPVPCPASTAMRAPRSVVESRRRASASRTVERPGPGPTGRSRSSESSVVPPTMPSAGSPTFSWNSRTPRSVRSPKIPSSRPASNPRMLSRSWSPRTSSPRAKGYRRYRTRSPDAYPASTSSCQVSGPTLPSTRRFRSCWNARTAASVAAPNSPATSGSLRCPRTARRAWTSRTSSPRTPATMVRMAPIVRHDERRCSVRPGGARA